MVWANTSTREPRVDSTIGPNAVNGGQMATSTPLTVDKRGSSAAAKLSASATVLYIFQLPAISGVRLIAAPPLRAGACPRSAPGPLRRRLTGQAPRLPP